VGHAQLCRLLKNFTREEAKLPETCWQLTEHGPHRTSRTWRTGSCLLRATGEQARVSSGKRGVHPEGHQLRPRPVSGRGVDLTRVTSGSRPWSSNGTAAQARGQIAAGPDSGHNEPGGGWGRSRDGCDPHPTDSGRDLPDKPSPLDEPPPGPHGPVPGAHVGPGTGNAAPVSGSGSSAASGGGGGGGMPRDRGRSVTWSANHTGEQSHETPGMDLCTSSSR